jgi:SAM-dependent methyltransferase
MKCRHCKAELTLLCLDLGCAPPSNAYLTAAALSAPEKRFPLRVWVCQKCWLVQIEDCAEAEMLFSPDYAYFSSTSTKWLSHARDYVGRMVRRFKLGAESRVVEIAANDGYLLQYVQKQGIPCIGIEPTASTAAAARAKGLEIIEAFFGVQLARELLDRGLAADLIVANNVLAHVPDINDFSAGCARLLKPSGVATFEFHHLLKMVALCQFDAVYHEHYSYLSLTAVRRIFSANGLAVFDVEELPTHGGSLRVFAARADSARRRSEKGARERVERLVEKEAAAGVKTDAFYGGFQARAETVKNGFLSFLMDAKTAGKKVAAYGAAAKGNTLINFTGIRGDLLSFVADRCPSKQGKFLPGSRIPIVEETRLRDARPEYVVILPWNIKDEVMEQLSYIRSWGGKFVTAVPQVEIR